MTIPNFKSQEDYQEFLNLFDDRWQVKLTLLNRVKDDMYPGYNWDTLQPKTLETINDITQSLLYDVEWTFKDKHPEYKQDDDDIFIPRRSFKEDVTEALLEANQKFWNSANEPLECPPWDDLACETFLGDHEG